MKNNLIQLSVLCMVISAAACGGGRGNSRDDTANRKDSVMAAADSINSPRRDSIENAPVAPPDSADVLFVTKAAAGGSLEVQLGNLAGSTAVSARVRDFGEMMMKDHTDANFNLKAVASQLHIMIPDSLPDSLARHKQMLSAKKGASFDKAYMSMMLKDHVKDIADFEKASKSNNQLVKDFATKTLPVLKKHLDSATAIAKAPIKSQTP